MVSGTATVLQTLVAASTTVTTPTRMAKEKRKRRKGTKGSTETDAETEDDESQRLEAAVKHLQVLALLPLQGVSQEDLVLPASILGDEHGKKYLWAKNGLATLVHLAAKQVWRDCIWIWKELEIDNNFNNGMRIDAKNRHKSVSDWVGRARAPHWMLSKESPAVYEVKFWTWWRGLQPDWQTNSLESEDNVVTPMHLVPGVGEDWECLRCLGPNGLLSVLAALLFWGKMVYTLPMAGFRAEENFNAAEKAWELAAEDVRVVLMGLLSTRGLI